MTYGVVNADLMTTSDGVSSAGLYGFKNRIINGDMRIDQRNAGASVTPITAQYLTDRFQAVLTQASKFTAIQSTTAPVGFNNSLLITSSSAYSVVTSDVFAVQQVIEGYNIADLGWGSASAQTITLSFWVRSSLTGTFGGSLRNADNNRSYPFTYTINSANTWEYKTITVAGDTSGTWQTTNLGGIKVVFGLGVGTTYSGTAGTWAGANYLSATGATSVVGTNGATFYITGVQLEKGSTATSFDYRPYGTELALCQRYLPVIDSGGTSMYYTGQCSSTTQTYAAMPFPVPVRTNPTGITLSAAASAYGVTNSAAAQLACTAITFNTAGINSGTVAASVASGLVAGNATLFNLYNNKIFFTGCEL